jgi:hypothetical protein
MKYRFLIALKDSLLLLAAIHTYVMYDKSQHPMFLISSLLFCFSVLVGRKLYYDYED